METSAYYRSSEGEELDSKAAVRPGRNYGPMPLIVLTATGFGPPPPDLPPAVKEGLARYQAEIPAAHQALARLSTRGVDRAVPGADHFIPQNHPQVVIDAIDEVVDEARALGR
jgi:hypothetical protein